MLNYFIDLLGSDIELLFIFKIYFFFKKMYMFNICYLYVVIIFLDKLI